MEEFGLIANFADNKGFFLKVTILTKSNQIKIKYHRSTHKKVVLNP